MAESLTVALTAFSGIVQNLVADAIYDALKSRLRKGPLIDKEEIRKIISETVPKIHEEYLKKYRQALEDALGKHDGIITEIIVREISRLLEKYEISRPKSIVTDEETAYKLARKVARRFVRKSVVLPRTLTEIKIVEALGTYGPRNLELVARNLGYPTARVRYAIRRMISKNFLRFHANLYHTNLGLSVAAVLAEAAPGQERLLFRCLRINDFWWWLWRCYGMSEGCYGVYTIPVGNVNEFELFLHEIRKSGLAGDIECLWLTGFKTVGLSSEWYDPRYENWNFLWDKWLSEIPIKKKIGLPHSLVDSKHYPRKADRIDLLILKELEKDATTPLAAIAKMLKLTPQTIRYHYRKHILEGNLIEDFEVFMFRFGRSMSEEMVFVFNSGNPGKLTNFALSLLGKPFVRSLGKVLNKSALVAQMCFPRIEFRRFIEVLSKCIEEGFLDSYRYAILDLSMASRQTVSYEYFNGKSWVYQHMNYMEKLKNFMDLGKK